MRTTSKADHKLMGHFDSFLLNCMRRKIETTKASLFGGEINAPLLIYDLFTIKIGGIMVQNSLLHGSMSFTGR